MRWHVVVPFRSVNEHGIAIFHKTRKECVQIAANIRVGVLLDQQRGGSVEDMQREQALLKMIVRHPTLDLAGKLVKSASLCGDFQLVRKLAKHASGYFWDDSDAPLVVNAF